MRIIRMTPEEWASIFDNPIQRDTEAHAKKAINGHLRVASSSQAVVHAAILPDGRMFKLDGHTRAMLWMDGRLPAPSIVQVVVHEAASLVQVIDLYKHFDSPQAAEGAIDRLSGAYRLHGVSPKSSLITGGGVTSALSLIDNNKTVYEMVGEWRNELTLLDELDAQKKAMPSTLLCAALLTLRKHGPRALEFWRLYAASAGTRIDGKSCGVDELTRIVADLRARKMLATGGWAARQSQVGRALSCCDAWVQGRMYVGSSRTTDMQSYIASITPKTNRGSSRL